MSETAASTRDCLKCGQTKVVAPETWPYRKGRNGLYQAHGNTCLACDHLRKQEYEKTRVRIRASVTEAEAALPADPKEAKKAAKLDVALALKAGGRVLNEFAPNVLARVLQYAEDPDHPLHQWALDKLVDRILPRKLYEELGAEAAGVGGLKEKHTYVIQVMPANPQEPTGRVIEGESSPVSVLPSPTEPTQE